MDSKQWKEFYIGGECGIFTLKASKSGIDKNKLFDTKEKTIPYITRSEIDNGYASFVGTVQQPKYKLDNSNVITVGLDTQTVFYQPHTFYTGQNIQVISNKELTKWSALFISRLLKIQLKKFNWGGNGATLGRLEKTKIMLPVDKNGKPDYSYMEQYVSNMMVHKYNDYIQYAQNKNIL